MSTYYKTCSHCGSNLDPGEKCDCDNPLYKEPEEPQHIHSFQELRQDGWFIEQRQNPLNRSTEFRFRKGDFNFTQTVPNALLVDVTKENIQTLEGAICLGTISHYAKEVCQHG